MYTVPPNTATVSSPVLIVGTVNVNALPAPGVGFCYRLAGIALSVTRSAAAGAFIDMFLDDGGPVNFLTMRGFSLSATGNAYIPLPEPGLQWTANTPVRFSAASTVAGGSTQCHLYYYTDFIG